MIAADIELARLDFLRLLRQFRAEKAYAMLRRLLTYWLPFLPFILAIISRYIPDEAMPCAVRLY